MSVTWQWAPGALWDKAQRDALHVPKALGQVLIQHKTAGAIPTALWSWVEFMALCGEQMASTAPSATEIIAKRNKAREIARFGVFFIQSCGVVCLFVSLEKGGKKNQTYVLTTYLEYEFHDWKILRDRLESDFHPNNPIECKKDVLQNPATSLIQQIRFVITSCRVLKESIF